MKYPATYIGSYRKQYFDEDILYMYYKYRGHESLKDQHAYDQNKNQKPQDKLTIDECIKELMDYFNS